ncbi:MAG: hypothetical protein WBO73_12870 [Gammaproteobacteria bacterium]
MDIHHPSPRLYPDTMEEIMYPDHLVVRKVKQGYIKLNGHPFYITRQLAGEYVGLESLDYGCWQLYFSELRLAVVDERLKRVIRAV